MKRLTTYKLFEANKSPNDLRLDEELIDAVCNQNYNLDGIKKVVDAGADINCKNHAGYTPLLLSISRYADYVLFFIKAGADLNLRNNNGETALYHSIYFSTYDITKMLIDAGADINIPNNDNITPLIKASGDNYFDRMLLLLEAGADVSIKTVKGENFIDVIEKDARYLKLSYYIKWYDWFDKENTQKMLLDKDPLLYLSMVKKDIKIHPNIKKKYSHIVSGSDLNLI